MTSQISDSSPSGTPFKNLRYRLQRLYREACEPSTREVARRTNHAVSHTTVSAVLRCEKLPGWGQLELIVEALGGNRDEFRRLWVAVRDEQDPQDAPPLPEPGEGAEHLGAELEWSPPMTTPELDAARAAFEELIANLDERIGQKVEELLTAREDRADRSDEIVRLRSQAVEDQSRRQVLEARIAELEGECGQLTGRINELEGELRQLNDDRTRLREERNELDQRWAELRKAELLHKAKQAIQDDQHKTGRNDSFSPGSVESETSRGMGGVLRTVYDVAREIRQSIAITSDDDLTMALGRLAHVLDGSGHRDSVNLLAEALRIRGEYLEALHAAVGRADTYLETHAYGSSADG